jgi:preprotein translocase SecE subunit
MAVAVKNTPQTFTQSPFNRLAVDSLLGVLYVLGSLGVVFYAIPAAWSAWLAPALPGAVSVALMLVVMVLAALGLVALGARLAATTPVHGLRAGIFVGAAEVVAALLITSWLGNLLARALPEQPALGVAITVAIGVALLVLVGLTLVLPRCERFLLQLEDQGWFSAAPYKRTQGQRVRRGTILGILVLAGCGIYTLLQHNTLAAGPRHWEVAIPFTQGWTWIVLPDVRITLPLLLALASLWLAYRVVSLPAFADFLIATEAELNKVSWTTRRRLIQDTVVVLVTVVLLTAFLFVVDQTWAFLLTKVGVVQIAPSDTQQVGPREQPW